MSNGAGLSYDALGRLYEVTSSGAASTRFQYDGSDLITEYDSSGAVLRRYIHGLGDDEPLVMLEGAGVWQSINNRNFLVTDQQGSVVAVTNGSGVATQVGAYDEYGVQSGAGTGRFQYTGQAWLPEADVYYYKARVYSPTLGRFLQADPIGYGAGMNMYAYVGGDPVNLNDPSGLDGCAPGPGNCIGEAVSTGTRLTIISGLAFNNLGPSGALTRISNVDTVVAELVVTSPKKKCTADKADFFDAQMGPASAVAQKRGVDVAHLLGLSAHESNWGRSRMARTLNNPFGATPGGDATAGIGYKSFGHAWAQWDREWGARVQGTGSDMSKFTSQLLLDNRKSPPGAADSRGAYNPLVAPAGDPAWESKIHGTIKSVNKRLPAYKDCK